MNFFPFFSKQFNDIRATAPAHKSDDDIRKLVSSKRSSEDIDAVVNGWWEEDAPVVADWVDAKPAPKKTAAPSVYRDINKVGVPKDRRPGYGNSAGGSFEPSKRKEKRKGYDSDIKEQVRAGEEKAQTKAPEATPTVEQLKSAAAPAPSAPAPVAAETRTPLKESNTAAAEATKAAPPKNAWGTATSWSSMVSQPKPAAPQKQNVAPVPAVKTAVAAAPETKPASATTTNTADVSAAFNKILATPAPVAAPVPAVAVVAAPVAPVVPVPEVKVVAAPAPTPAPAVTAPAAGGNMWGSSKSLAQKLQQPKPVEEKKREVKAVPAKAPKVVEAADAAPVTVAVAAVEAADAVKETADATKGRNAAPRNNKGRTNSKEVPAPAEVPVVTAAAEPAASPAVAAASSPVKSKAATKSAATGEVNLGKFGQGNNANIDFVFGSVSEAPSAKVFAGASPLAPAPGLRSPIRSPEKSAVVAPPKAVAPAAPSAASVVAAPASSASSSLSKSFSAPAATPSVLDVGAKLDAVLNSKPPSSGPPGLPAMRSHEEVEREQIAKAERLAAKVAKDALGTKETAAAKDGDKLNAAAPGRNVPLTSKIAGPGVKSPSVGPSSLPASSDPLAAPADHFLYGGQFGLPYGTYMNAAPGVPGYGSSISGSTDGGFSGYGYAPPLAPGSGAPSSGVMPDAATMMQMQQQLHMQQIALARNQQHMAHSLPSHGLNGMPSSSSTIASSSSDASATTDSASGDVGATHAPPGMYPQQMYAMPYQHYPPYYNPYGGFPYGRGNVGYAPQGDGRGMPLPHDPSASGYFPNMGAINIGYGDATSSGGYGSSDAYGSGGMNSSNGGKPRNNSRNNSRNPNNSHHAGGASGGFTSQQYWNAAPGYGGVPGPASWGIVPPPSFPSPLNSTSQFSTGLGGPRSNTTTSGGKSGSTSGTVPSSVGGGWSTHS